MRRNNKKNHLSSITIGAWISLCVILLLFFGKGNPSRTESEAKLAMMDSDMKAALQEGGVVASRYSNAKIGGALLYVNLDAQSWSQVLRGRYRAALEHLGWEWRSSENGGDSFCKQGMIAIIRSVPDIDASRGLPRKVYAFSMKYDGFTREECP
jgi:hypothetical protein